MKTIDDLAHGRDNNFNFVRMVAASAVLLSHSWPIALGIHAAEPLQSESGYKLGTTAVLIFFAISGFFITKSVDRTRSTREFLTARILRLYPALIVALGLTVVVLGPLFTDLTFSRYASAWHTWTYLPRNALLYRPQWELPGVFAPNIYGAAINGSLWTLFYEVSCYLLVLGIGLVGLLDARRFPIVIVLFIAAQIYLRHGIVGTPGNGFALLSLPFFIGVVCYVYRFSLPLSGWVAGVLAVVTALTAKTPAYHVLYALALSYGALWFGSIGWPALKLYNRVGDYSYGMYIYAFPVQQILVTLYHPANPWLLTAMAFPISLLLAILSWTVIEKPALGQRHYFGRPSPKGLRS